MKKQIAVVFGSRSVEHEVSIITAMQVMRALNPDAYDVIPIYIAKTGEWYTGATLKDLATFKKLNLAELEKVQLMLDPASPHLFRTQGKGLFVKERGIHVYVVFPAMHGTNGEDGTLQGLLELTGVPYVGAGVLGSAVGMDKVLMKAAFEQNNLPVVSYLWVLRSQLKKKQEEVLAWIEGNLRYPLFVKPANLGSSVGISRARNRDELQFALDVAGHYDRKLLVEEAVEAAREINCAVMGNEELVASACEEPISWESFLSYDDKYLHGQAGKGMKGSRRRVPADIPDELTHEIQDLAIKAFRAVDCRGIARVDLLVDRETQAVYLNEVNTLPGSMSFYLWQPLGLTPSQVVDNLIQLAIEAAEDKARTTFSYDSNLLEKADLSLAQK
jgi:D-alanine-D-alanine ligase